VGKLPREREKYGGLDYGSNGHQIGNLKHIVVVSRRHPTNDQECRDYTQGNKNYSEDIAGSL
jgi:hypothetical protein